MNRIKMVLIMKGCMSLLLIGKKSFQSPEWAWGQVIVLRNYVSFVKRYL